MTNHIDIDKRQVCICGYSWQARVKNPKRCPRCGAWLPWWAERERLVQDALAGQKETGS